MSTFFTKPLALAASISLLSTCLHAQQSLTGLVNPLVGTAHEGQTYPAVGVPYGMTQWTPATRTGEAKGIVPYFYNDTRILGFRGSHFLSGSATQDYGSFQLLAGHGQPDLTQGQPGSTYSHQHETATPYRYDVELPDLDVHAAITGASRSGIMRFTFHRGGRVWIAVMTNARPGDGIVEVSQSTHEVTGSSRARRLYAGAGQLAGFSGHTAIEFDHPFHTGGTWSAKQLHEGALRVESSEDSTGVYVAFDVKPGESVQAKIGTSFTSVDEARKNLHAEIPAWNFEQVQASSKKAWEKSLSAIFVQGDPVDRRIFYTSMYHAMQLPRVFSDVSGSYPQFAGGKQIEHTKSFTYYDDFSLWDTFRALHPMLTILDPLRETEMIQSLIAKGEQGGFLPIFPAWNSYTSEMIGDHATSIIADAYIKGIRGFDAEKAYALMRKNALDLPQDIAEYKDGKGRRALQSYLKYGYVPLEDPVADAFHNGEQVSRTLEYAYDDFVVAQMAKALGKTDDAKLFTTPAQNYRNVIDPETGFARGRHADGTWDSPFDPTKPYHYITEGLPFQYTFFVPQDLRGLIELEHGNAAFIAKLDALFNGKYYDHGNEPSHHITYLYDFAGAAYKTQRHVAEARSSQYADAPGGLSGNDDAGQMSAWYILSALGFYPVTPGIPAYEIGTPLFSDARILLPNSKSFHITAKGVSKSAIYIQSATLNGHPLQRYWLKHEEIMQGGELVFQMGENPQIAWPSESSMPMEPITP